MNCFQVPLEGRLMVVAGGGSFGARAAKHAKESSARVAIVDIDPHCAAAVYADETLGVIEKRSLDIRRGWAVLFVQDAVDFVLDLLRLTTPDYITPAVPGHLAGWVIEGWIKSQGLCVAAGSGASRRVASAMPHGTVLYTDEARGIIVTSYMPRGLICRVPCRQPVDHCPTTGRVKAGPMHSILSEAAEGNATLSRVLVSRLAGPGVGCFRGEELASLIASAKLLVPPYTLAVGTSCECHGVLNTFSVTRL